MNFPEFTIELLGTYGINYDPRTYTISPSHFREVLTTSYEFEFHPSDWEGSIRINGNSFAISKGCFSCAKPHQTRKRTPPYQCYMLYISTKDPQLAKALDALPDYAQHPDMDTILDLIQKMIRVDTRNTLDGRLELWIYACSILRLLLQEQYAVANATLGNARRHQDALLAANQYLKEHIQEDVDLVNLAKESGLHPTYFHKLFKAAFGRTPSEQLTRYRIRASWQFLRDDSMPIGEIAMRCGFSSQSYFCRIFKLYSSQTPSQFRRTLRKRRTK